MRKTIFTTALFSFLLLGVSQATAHTETAVLDAKKSIFLKLETTNIGPDLQCYYGSVGANAFLFPVVINSTPLVEKNAFQFSQTIEVSIIDAKKMNEASFGSRVTCWIINEAQYSSATRPANISVEIFQDSKQILVKDSFGFLTRVSDGMDLWTTPKVVSKRVKFLVAE